MSIRCARSLVLAVAVLGILGCGNPPSNPDGAVVCTPESNGAFCNRLHKTCDSVTAADNCGASRTVSCGTCLAPMICGGGGVSNVCWCDGPDGGGCYTKDGGGGAPDVGSVPGPDAGCSGADGSCAQPPDAAVGPGLDAASTTPDGGVDPADASFALPDGAVLEISTLDPNASGDWPISLAVRGSKIAVAYWVDADASITVSVHADAGTYVNVTESLHELRYVELGGAPESVAGSYNVYGGSLVIDSAGTPSIAYLGPPAIPASKWLEAAAVVATRSATGPTWQQSVAASATNHALGLWASAAIDSTDRLHIGYRNVHYGVFPTQDFAASNMELVSGTPGTWDTTGVNCAADGSCPAYGNLASVGVGNFVSLALSGASQEPALVWSNSDTATTSPAKDIWFTVHSSSGWPHLGTMGPSLKIRSVANTGTGMGGSAYGGPQLAWDSGLGFAVAWDDHNAGELNVLIGADLAALRSGTPELVFGASATGGWYPALAVSPGGQPALAYYVCTNQPKATACMSTDDRVEISRRVAANSWQPELVDPAGGHHIRLAFLADGRAVVAYRDVGHTAIKLAIVPP
jgi:hypothetical protein